jgi:hypothetical protein
VGDSRNVRARNMHASGFFGFSLKCSIFISNEHSS